MTDKEDKKFAVRIDTGEWTTEEKAVVIKIVGDTYETLHRLVEFLEKFSERVDNDEKAIIAEQGNADIFNKRLSDLEQKLAFLEKVRDDSKKHQFYLG